MVLIKYGKIEGKVMKYELCTQKARKSRTSKREDKDKF